MDRVQPFLDIAGGKGRGGRNSAIFGGKFGQELKWR